ncbi:hypothetical protein THAOC_19382 [Thalassiosira oceanica]|uniref:Cytosolic carboxypeptidase N-terminal domain-containing protein n=1 Tax=Thalassiosira oceanica TaxID=159749 RepID=K0SH25_THAOC|nr:hypothetical protein THAOC_19382 [Thalassiosira oceanica]|eukprot:EJK60286.1 hypothetical protein THAOC_19382 [Thalassiosira oceanica]
MDINGQEKAKATATCRPVSTAVATPPARSAAQPVISISDSFDGGNAEFSGLKLVDGEEDFCDVHVTVNIRKDPFTELESKEHFQYFSFRSTLNRDAPAMKGLFQGKKSIKVKYILENAGKTLIDCEASYAHAFRGYSTFYTQTSPFDPDSWRRKDDTAFDGGALTWTHVHDLDSPTACFAYFPPYSYERHLGLVAKCAESGVDATVRSLGQSVEGREIDCVKVGNGPRTCWIIHRQHPGESMAEFYAGIADAAAGIGREVGQRRGQGEGALHVSHRAERQPRRKYQRPPEDERGRAESQQGMVSQPRAGGRRGRDVRRPDRREEPRGAQRPPRHGRHRLRRLPRRARRRGPPVQLPRRVRGHAGLVRPAPVAPRRVPRVVPAGEPRHAGEGELRAGRARTGHAAHLLEPDRAALRLPGGDARDALQGDARGHARAEGEDGWGPDRARRLGASVLDPLCYVQPHLRGDGWSELTDESDAYIRPTDKY